MSNINSIQKELERLSEEWKPPPPPSKKAPWYSYHFQCWNCLTLHEGTIQSDNQLLELECKELLTHYEGGPAPSLLAMLGKPKVCGKINHVFGRKINKKNDK